MLDDVRRWEQERPAGAPEIVLISKGGVSANRALNLRSTILLDEGFEVGRAIGEHYGIGLPSFSANYYRDGNDSVAWHGDNSGKLVETTVVAIVSLGSPRRLLLRPKGGGPSRCFPLAQGDLLVMGGTCQRTFDHAVPKTASAGPRISIMFREET